MDSYKQIAYNIPFTNKIYIDYPLFKKIIINPIQYESILKEFQIIIEEVKKKYTSYEIHINALSFTTKTPVKYYHFSQLLYLSNICKADEINTLVVYNVSKLIDNCSTIILHLIGKEYKNKITLHIKSESNILLDSLLVK
jgi:hypothetical protein